MKLCFRFLLLLFIGLLAPALVLASEYSSQVEDLLDKGERFLSEGKAKSARQLYEEALTLEPNCPDAFNGLGLTYKMEGNYDQAATSYASALKINPDHYDSIYNLANAYYLTQNYPEAVTLYLRAMRLKGAPDADLLSSLATVYRDKARAESGQSRKADWDHSLSFYQQAAKQDPDSPKVPAYLGQLYADMGNLELAEEEFKRAIALKRDYAFAYFHLGRLERLRGRLPAALISWRYSLKYETVPQYRDETLALIKEMGMPSAAMEHFAQGYEYLAERLYDMADAEFEAVAALPGPLQAVALNNLGYVRAKQNSHKRAISAFSEAIKISPKGHPEFYFNLGQSLRLSGDFNQAEKELNIALAQAKGNYPLAQNALALVLKQKGNLEAALKHYNFAQLQSADALPVVHLNKALLLEKQGKQKEALRSYQLYLKSEPEGTCSDFVRVRIMALK